MIFKFVPIFALLALAHCRPGLQQVYQTPAAIIQPAPLLAQPALLKKEIYDPNPQYNFAYDIKDALTGDIKSQQEVLEGGVVKGQYSLLEADGRQRIVNYYADPINGFNANVQYAGVVAPQPDATIIKTPTLLKAAPTLIKTTPVLGFQQSPVLAATYTKTLAPIVSTYTKSLVPAVGSAYATGLPYGATSIVKY